MGGLFQVYSPWLLEVSEDLKYLKHDSVINEEVMTMSRPSQGVLEMEGVEMLETSLADVT